MDDEGRESSGERSEVRAHPADTAVQPRRFQYQTLEDPRDIRLLRVSWNQSSKRICVEFSIVSLDSPSLSYEAISYCWGDATPRGRVWVGDDQYLDITESVADILQHLIGEKKSGYVWIDALCINQSKDGINEEKGHQIRLMRDIFASATWVIAWLGNRSEDSDLAIEFMGVLSNKIENFKAQEMEHGKLSVQRMFSDLPQKSDPRWKAFHNLLDRPWFNRIWIVQEMVMASQRVFLCGNTAVHWDDLIRILGFFHRNDLELYFLEARKAGEVSTLISGSANLNKMAYYCRRIQTGYLPPFQEIIADLQTFEASDPRDKIFAVLGMACDGQDAIFNPEYTSAPQDIFIRVCRFLMVRDADLTLLHHAGIGTPRVLAEVPSWAADFSLTRTSTSFAPLLNIVSWRTSSPESQVSIREHSSIQNSIVLSGCIVDSVNIVAEQFPTAPFHRSPEEVGPHASKFMAVMDEWNSLLEGLDPYPTAEACSDVQWRTLLCNIGRNSCEATLEYSDYYRSYLTLTRLMASSVSAEEFSEKLPVHLFDGFYTFANALSRSRKRRLFTTTSGYAGKGARENMSSGDKICIFHGARTPFIIRPNPGLEGKELTYTLISDCYVHGLMHGEGQELGVTEDIILI